MPRWSTFDLVEAYQLASAVAALHELDLLESMQRPATAKELAIRCGIDANLLRGVLEYVSARTDLLRKTKGKFLATRDYAEKSRFLLDLYVGAYGPNAARLSELLHKPVMAQKSVDRVHHARAFAAVDGAPIGLLPSLIIELGFNRLLDLGCGSAGLLLEVAAKDAKFMGWGLEKNPAMCKVARARVRDAGVGRRIRLLQGDCTELSSILPEDVKEQVDAVSACNVANEMFARGDSQVVKWLQDLRKVFSGRLFLLVDYYGQLGQQQVFNGSAILRATLLHDYVQLISGQGIPPVNLKQWRSIYKKAACRLVHVFEDKLTTRFIHILSL
jgi:SAM-dependent methyltransferase